MKAHHLILAGLLLPTLPGFAQSPVSSGPPTYMGAPARPGSPIGAVPQISSGEDLQKYLLGSTWSWKWANTRHPAEAITFLADGTVHHAMFTAKATFKNATEIELKLGKKTANLKFDPSFRSYEGIDFNGTRPLIGELRNMPVASASPLPATSSGQPVATAVAPAAKPLFSLPALPVPPSPPQTASRTSQPGMDKLVPPPSISGLPAQGNGTRSGVAGTPAANSAPRTNSVVLNVTTLSSGSSVQVNKGNRTGRINGPGGAGYSFSASEQLTSAQSHGININLGNIGRAPSTVRVEWYFVAGPVKPDLRRPTAEQDYIDDKGTQSVTLNPNGSENINCESKAVYAVNQRKIGSMAGAGRDFRHVEIQASTASGTMYRGWMVRVMADGAIIASAGSTEPYNVWVRDTGKLPLPP